MKRLWGAAYPSTAPAPDPGPVAPADDPGGYSPALPVDLLQQPNGMALDQAVRAAAFAEQLPRETYQGLVDRMRAVGNGDVPAMSGQEVVAALARTHGAREAPGLVRDAAALLGRMVDRDPRMADVAALLAGDPGAIGALAYHERFRRSGR